MEGRVVVVTGGASGIGRATALACARRGADVMVADVDDEGLDETVAELQAVGVRAEALHTDVADDDAVARLARVTLERLGRADVVMANAGVNATPDDTMRGWQWLADINLYGVVRTIDAFLPHLLERGTGYVIATSSAHGLFGGGGAYTLAKWGVVGYAESVALAHRRAGVGASVFCPGFVSTGLIRSTARILGRTAPPSPPPEALARLPGMITPEDAAEQLLAGLDAGRFLITTSLPERIAGELRARADALESTHWTLPPYFKGDRASLWRRAIGAEPPPDGA